jgi:hypothetical protein
MPGALTIISGAADPGALEAVSRNAQLVFLPKTEYGPYEAFIRRTEALRAFARGAADVALVDRGCLLSGTQSRMLERIARGLSATVVGAPWHGIKPQAFPRNPGPGIGNWAAPALLVGSGPAQAGTPPYWPFISSRPDGPAAWLTEQLELAGVREEDLYWMNAQTVVDGNLVCEDASTVLENPWRLVVCMGEEALKWAEDWGLSNMVLAPYPTWWWNYRRGKDYPALKAIEGACSGVQTNAQSR